ncbi:hypothetical protein BVRB_7g162900 [Beta vulgaris subsp. vulgaris]|nr:hypothetical protein BVRB_7g162900 [Beta vulgaris subsp. vulgaris]
MLSCAKFASNLQRQCQNDVGSIAKQLDIEDPFHENGEDVRAEQVNNEMPAATSDEYTSMNRQTAFEWISPFNEIREMASLKINQSPLGPRPNQELILSNNHPMG